MIRWQRQRSQELAAGMSLTCPVWTLYPNSWQLLLKSACSQSGEGLNKRTSRTLLVDTLTNLPDHGRIPGCAAKPDTCAVKCVDVQHVVPPARCSARTATLRPAQLRSLPGTTIHPLQSRGSWTSCRHELAAPVLLWADKVNYHPADPPAPSAMVATYTDQWSGRRLRQAA